MKAGRLVTALFLLAAAGAPAAAQPAGPGIRYAVEIVIEGEAGDLRTTISDNSLLVAEEETPPETPGELIARGASDIGRATAALYADARYGGTVEVLAAGVPVLDPDADRAIAAAALAGPVPVAIRIVPGPAFTIGEVRITGLPPGGPVLDARRIELAPGQPARAADVLAAETEIVRQIEAQGYPLAAVPTRDAVVDHARMTLDVTFHVEPGGRAALGRTEVEGTERLDPAFVARMAPFGPGEPDDPAVLERYAERLRALDIVSSVRVRPGDAIGPDGTVPVIVTIGERPPRVIGAGAFYSSTEGASFNAYWAHRNLFGNAETLRIEGEVSRLFLGPLLDSDLSLAARFTKPGAITPADTLLASMRFVRQSPEAYRRLAFNADVRLRRELTERLSVEGGLELEVSRVTDSFGTANHFLVGVPLAATYDSTDDRLAPTSGYRATLLVEPMMDFAAPRTFFTLVRGQVSAYRALGEAQRFVLAGRVRAGTIIGAPLAQIPADRRFYAGGGGSIRGVAYQNASPRDGAGNITGGRSLLEASLEMRIQLTDRIGIVPFVDAGGAFLSPLPDPSGGLKFGAGIGLRYRTPIGPVRVDVAVPLNRGPGDPGFGVYIGLGESF